MAISPTFGDLLRQHRLAAGLTQEALAERAGLSMHGIQKLERGVTRPYRDTVRRLLAALKLSGDDLGQLWTAAGAAPRAPRVLAGVDAARHNLPIPVTSFIGRDQELGEVVRRLTDARLLTLTGIGGCGKTRLALELARTVLERYSDGVWLVELAPIADPTLVPHLVAKAIGVRESTDQTVTEALISALRNRHLLLILDNCEHLLDACARMVDELVHACAQVQVLATSREALGITGEIARRVPSLAIPDAHKQFTLAELGANPAVQLFVERATALLPRFALTEQNASASAQICRRLDGIPLALELAAARVEALTPEQIAARLDQRFRLLTGGSRAAMPRQQTLRATLDWSYDLLTEPEQVLLNRLSVFAAGWSLEAAEVVSADERIASVDVLDLLAHLVSKSLVQADEAGDGTERYRLLETVRQYARERLVAAGEAEAVHERHAAYFLAFGDVVNVAQYIDAFVVPTAEQFDRLERELENLRAALRWWIESQDVPRAIKQAGILYFVWMWRGPLTEGQANLQEILAINSMPGSSASRRRGLQMVANLALRHADYVVGLDALEELLTLEQSTGDRHGVAYAYIELANVHFLRAAYRDAWAFLDVGWVEASSLGDQRLENRCRLYGSMLALCDGRYELARTLSVQAVTAYESENKRMSAAFSEMTLGNVDLVQGNYDEANARFLHTLEVASEFGERTLLAHTLEGFSGLASALGQHQRGVRLGGAAAALREAAGAPLGPAWGPIAERWLAVSRQALGEQASSAAWVAGRGLPIQRVFEEAEDTTGATCDPPPFASSS
jgi:predicted ATPase/DNA-binding XRE family transcriptional regulator